MADNSGFVQAQGVVSYGSLNPLDNVWRAIGVESVTDVGNAVEVVLQNGMDPDGVSISVLPERSLLATVPVAAVERIAGGFRVIINETAGQAPGPVAGGTFWFSVMQIPRDCAPAPVA